VKKINVIQVSADDGEKPFWISYSDLMTALMILFLVIMVSSLTSISQQILKVQPVESDSNPLAAEKPEISKEIDSEKQNFPNAIRQASENRLKELSKICNQIQSMPIINEIDAKVDCNSHKIDLGSAGQFGANEYKLSYEGTQKLSKLIPAIVETANSSLGRKWLKRIHIQGFTDPQGSYLYNLHLSLRRSEWVMCQIVQTHSEPGFQLPLTDQERNTAKQLFVIGGVSFNNIKENNSESRRVEFKLEFLDMSEARNGEVVVDHIPPSKEEKCRI
jgi:outer membrane protein OmpA-like peptidoglycan-associated protein